MSEYTPSGSDAIMATWKTLVKRYGPGFAGDITQDERHELVAAVLAALPLDRQVAFAYGVVVEYDGKVLDPRRVTLRYADGRLPPSEEYVVCHARGYLNPHHVWPQTREYAVRFARENSGLVRRRLATEWEDLEDFRPQAERETQQGGLQSERSTAGP